MGEASWLLTGWLGPLIQRACAEHTPGDRRVRDARNADRVHGDVRVGRLLPGPRDVLPAAVLAPGWHSRCCVILLLQPQIDGTICKGQSCTRKTAQLLSAFSARRVATYMQTLATPAATEAQLKRIARTSWRVDSSQAGFERKGLPTHPPLCASSATPRSSGCSGARRDGPTRARPPRTLCPLRGLP